MSAFIDEQAEVSDNDGSESSEPTAKRRKVPSSKHRNKIASSSEDEDVEDDEIAARKEMKGFVVSEDEMEEEVDEDDDNKSGKSGSDVSDLLDDDLDLVNENMGNRTGGRVEISDDEEDRDRIRDELFVKDDEDFVERRPQRSRSASVSSRESYEDDDRFIVHDNENSNRRRRFEPSARNRDELREAQDIFGFEDDDVLGNMDNIFAELDEEEGAYEPGRHEQTLIGIIEPGELDKHDNEERKIIFNDVPERFQTRKIPVTSAEEDELKLESAWIQNNAFDEGKVISRQEGLGFSLVTSGAASKEDIDSDAPDKICEALKFIRNSNYEVPFIAFYRKEYVDNVLGIQDLWTIFEYDEKWMHFRDRKKRLKDLLTRMSNFTQDMQNADELIRPIDDKDFQDLEDAQTGEEIMDCFEHFQLYYSNFLTRMIQHEIEKNDDPEQRAAAIPKTTPRNDKYWNCTLNGPGTLTAAFGLTAEQVAENFVYIRHQCVTDEKTPEEFAESCVTQLFPEIEMVIDGAVYVMAYRLSREPGVRRKIREVFRTMAKIKVYPTKRGIVTIDESHPLYTKRYVEGKPIVELEKEEYLQYQVAKEGNLLNVEIYIDEPTLELTPFNNSAVVDEIKRENYFGADETMELSMKWNELRNRALTECVNILCKHLKKETHEILLTEAKNFVLREARSYFELRISPGRYRPIFGYSDDDTAENIEINNPIVRVIAIAPAADLSGETIAVALDPNGVVVDTCPISFQSRRGQINSDNKHVSMRAFIQLCANHKPHVIAVASTDMRALNLKRDLEKELKAAFEIGKLSQEIPLEFVTAEAAKIYSNSKMSEKEFPSYTPNTRLAISTGRTLLDPLVEYAHLCNSDNDFLGIRAHQLQNYVSAQEVSWCFQREFINRVSEVGVDINHCIDYPHTDGVLQFVCGLGPRKAQHVIQLLQHQGVTLDARSKLVTICNLGPTVFVNAAGFIRIDVEAIRNTADDYIEQLDGSRVHPETYEWARKMAIDALEFEENNDPSSAIDEIIAQPDRLKDLDLDAFAEELNRQGFGNKSITLYDIRAELNNQYKDLRIPFQTLYGMDLFREMVTNHAFYMQGKLVHGRVQRIVYVRTQFSQGNDDSQNEDGKPQKSDKYTQPQNSKDGGFFCPDCKEVFSDWSYVAHSHMGKLACKGRAIGVSIGLEDGVSGFIRRADISDEKTAVDEVCENLKPGQSIICRVKDFKEDRYSCDLTCKSEDLQQGESKDYDRYFNFDREQKDQQNLVSANEKNTVKTNFTKRVISHQSFHNVTHTDAERMLSTMSQGEAVIRPSSSSINHLAVTWKVTDGIYQHVRIEESKKKHAFDLGKELRIGSEVFEDLDEILARYITPLAESAREILNHRYFMKDFKSEDMSEIEESIRIQKDKIPGRIPYIFTASKDYPGKFVISYHAGRARHEYFTATPEGLRFRKNVFPSLEAMINWFKVHFRDAIPH